ncbi:ISBma1, transposase [Burkholderia pseudomallei]|nr:ISBma1, transposase [Burkholderia pseudomallei]
MGYRSDPDLEFLGEMKSSELDDLVHCLTRDTDGKLRRAEELTNSGPYKEYAPDHHRYWQLIAAELQRFGANTFTTFFVRWGEGILYREVTCLISSGHFNLGERPRLLQLNNTAA